MSENNKTLPEAADPREVSEEELKDVAGGNEESRPRCHFTWSGKEQKDGETVTHLECASRASSCTFCVCHKQPQCKDRWHALEVGNTGYWAGYNKYLYPCRTGNHFEKPPNTNYNTR